MQPEVGKRYSFRVEDCCVSVSGVGVLTRYMPRNDNEGFPRFYLFRFDDGYTEVSSNSVVLSEPPE